MAINSRRISIILSLLGLLLFLLYFPIRFYALLHMETEVDATKQDVYRVIDAKVGPVVLCCGSVLMLVNIGLSLRESSLDLKTIAWAVLIAISFGIGVFTLLS